MCFHNAEFFGTVVRYTIALEQRVMQFAKYERTHGFSLVEVRLYASRVLRNFEMWYALSKLNKL